MKKYACFALISFQLFLGIPIPQVFAQPFIPITAPSAVLLDLNSNRIIYAKTPHLRRAPASTTKILTAIVVLERMNLDERVRIPSFVTSIEPSKAHLKPGEIFSVRDLVRATLISSANDAAETLAFYGGGGSRSNFAEMMNQKIKSLGGNRSHFVRASGLPAENHYSTAYDMALVMREAERFPFIVETMKIKTITIRSSANRPIFLKNHNKMLWRSGSWVLGKTGWTRSARHCFVGVINASSRPVFVSMLGSRKLWTDLNQLASYPGGRPPYTAAPVAKSSRSTKISSIEIQKALKKTGFYKGRVDGVMGPSTRSAIRRFQKKNRIPATGHIGPRTTLALKPYL